MAVLFCLDAEVTREGNQSKHAQSYELPQPLNKENGHAHCSAHSTRRQRHMLEPNGKRTENWFNDSFEDGDYTEVRYAIRPSLHTNTASADIAKAWGSCKNKAKAVAAEENIYDFPEEVLASFSKSGKVEAYECPEKSVPAKPDDDYVNIASNTPVDVNLDDLYELPVDANPEDVYECLDELNTESADIYEAMDS